MNVGLQKLCVWSGIVFLLFFLVGFCLCADFLPPMSPALGPDQVAAFYVAHRSGIKAGAVMMMLGAMLSVPWAAVIAVHLARVENSRYPVLAITQLASGILDVLAFIPPAVFWAVAAFRAERSPQLVQTLNDLGWVGIVMLVSPAMLQALAIGLAILIHRNAQPEFPRWMGFTNLWFTLFFLGGTLVLFFKTGPFAWNGIIAYWIPLVLFGLWIVMNSWMMLRAIDAVARRARFDDT